MATEKKLDELIEPTRKRLSIDNPKENNLEQRALYDIFAAKDDQWKAIHTKKLLRKIDFHLLPFVIIMYTLNILDRSNLSQAREGSLEQDLGMTGTDFNLATSILFVGYLLMQLPSNVLITRVRPSLFLSAAMTTWGVVSTCNAATHNFTDLVVVRFFLGFVEAPFFPGVVFLMSSWYTRAELTRRLAWFYSGTSIANMFGGLIAAGVLGNLDGAHGIAGWRWLFIIEGSITIGVALISAFFLPDYPATTSWLAEEEKSFAAWRMLGDINETDESNATSVWIGVKMAFKDYRLYLFLLLQHMSILSQTFTYFFPSIVQTLGKNTPSKHYRVRWTGKITRSLRRNVSNHWRYRIWQDYNPSPYRPCLVRHLPRLGSSHLQLQQNKRSGATHLRPDARRRSRKRHRDWQYNHGRAILCYVSHAHRC